jgi:hypothetical protein
MTEERFPEFIMALPMKAAEKLVMVRGAKGMIYAINNPEASIGSWYLSAKTELGSTSHIVRAIQEDNIGIDEVLIMLSEVYKKVTEAEGIPKATCRYSNIASRISTIIQQAIREVKKRGRLTKQEITDLKEISKRAAKSASVATTKEMLSFSAVRDHLRVNFLKNNRFLIMVLEDPLLHCRTKIGILESYECFTKAVDDPSTLRKWH